jgi:hypothetical protein
MFTTQLTKPFHVAIAAGMLGAIFAAAPAQAADQSAWLQEQLAITDGASFVAIGAGESPAAVSSYKTDTQSVWVQKQLTITDGSAPVIRGDTEPVYAATTRAMSDKQFAFVEHALHQTDGS